MTTETTQAAPSGTVRADVGKLRQICCTCAHWRKCLNYDEDGHCVADGEQGPPIITDAYTRCGQWVANHVSGT